MKSYNQPSHMPSSSSRTEKFQINSALIGLNPDYASAMLELMFSVKWLLGQANNTCGEIVKWNRLLGIRPRWSCCFFSH